MMTLLEEKQSWGEETVMSPIFGLPSGEIRRDFQNLCQPSNRNKITLLVGLEGFEEFYASRLGPLAIFHHQNRLCIVRSWFHCISTTSIKWSY